MQQKYIPRVKYCTYGHPSLTEKKYNSKSLAKNLNKINFHYLGIKNQIE